MWKYLAAVVFGALLAASVFLVVKKIGPGESGSKASMNMEEGPGGLTKTKTIDMTGKIDIKNTKCLVSGDDIGASTLLAEYKGKVYHLCCDDCVEPFNKDPEKYVRDFDANPAKFGASVPAAATKP